MSPINFGLLLLAIILPIIWIMVDFFIIQPKVTNIHPERITNIQPERITNIASIDSDTLPSKNRDYDRIFNPLRQPQRRYDSYPNIVGSSTPFGNPTQGLFGAFQQMGYLSQQDGEKMKLFGRRSGRYEHDYFVTSGDDPTLKIPLNNKKELMDNESIQIPGYSGEFKVHLYELEGLRYNPYLL